MEPSAGANELAGAQPRAVAEVDQEAKSLRRGRVPAVGPFQAVGNCSDERPLAFGERPGRVQTRFAGTTHLYPRKGVRQDVALLDQPPEHRVEH